MTKWEETNCDSRPFYWLPASKRKGTKNLVSIHDVAQVGIPRQHLVKYLTQEIAESDSCKSLPFAIFLIFAYTFSAIQHEDAPTVSAMEHSIKHDILENANFAFSSKEMGFKGLEDVNSYTDFWSWMHNGFVPLIFHNNASWPVNQTINKSDSNISRIINDTASNTTNNTNTSMSNASRRLQQVINTSNTSNSSNMSNVTAPTPIPTEWRRVMVLHYNRIIGGVRMRQEVTGLFPSAPNEWCSTEKRLLPKYGLRCVKGYGYELDPEKMAVRTFGNASRVQWLYAHDSIPDLLEQVKEMELSGWIDNKTRRVEISIPLYNAEFGLYSLVNVHFFFSRGGHIFKDLDALSTYADWYPTSMYWVVDIAFISCLLWIMFREAVEIRDTIRQHGVIAGLKTYISIWNAVDWISVLAGSAIMILLRVNINLTDDLNNEAVKMAEMNPYADPPLYKTEVDTVMKALTAEINQCTNFRKIMACYPLVIIMRLFKAFAAQPRLAVVTNTLMAAASDLLHFLVVFVSVFGSYMVSGVQLMGREVDAFVTPVRAMNQLFRALQGDLDWESLLPVGRLWASLWFAAFSVLLNLILFNILIAIVMDAYGDVKAAMKGSEMLWEELRQEFETRVGLWNNQLIPLQLVVDLLKKDEQIFLKVDLQKKTTMPDVAEVNWMVAKNEAGASMVWECYKRVAKREPQFLCTNSDKSSGIVVVMNGLGDEIILRENEKREFAVKLDDEARFSWYYDGNQKGGNLKILLAAVRSSNDVDKDSSPEIITETYLMKAAKMMGDQSKYIMNHAILDYYNENDIDKGPEELNNLVLHFDHRMHKLLQVVAGIFKKPPPPPTSDNLSESASGADLRSRRSLRSRSLRSLRSSRTGFNSMAGMSYDLKSMAQTVTTLSKSSISHAASSASSLTGMKSANSKAEITANLSFSRVLIGFELKRFFTHIESMWWKFDRGPQRSLESLHTHREHMKKLRQKEAEEARNEDDEDEEEEEDDGLEDDENEESQDPNKCKCGAIFAITSDFCQTCGRMRPTGVVTEHFKCRCGNLLKLDARICRRCGAKRNPEEERRLQEEEKKRMEIVRQHNLEDQDGADTKVEDLSVGTEVQVLKELRRVVTVCQDAGLARENNDVRKMCAGRRGIVMRVDRVDNTVQVDVEGIGELWLAVGAIELVPDEEEEVKKEMEERAKKAEERRQRQERQTLYETKLAQAEELRKQVAMMEKTVQKVYTTVDEGKKMLGDLRSRVDRQLISKEKSRRMIASLEEKKKSLLKEGYHLGNEAKKAMDALNSGATTRDNYMGVLQQLSNEQQELMRLLAEEKTTFQNLKNEADSARAAEGEHIGELEAELARHHAHHARMSKEQQDNLAWLAGRADALVRDLEAGTNAGAQAPPVVLTNIKKLRDTALSLWKTLQNI